VTKSGTQRLYLWKSILKKLFKEDKFDQIWKQENISNMRNFQATHESSFSVFDQTFNGDSNTKCDLDHQWIMLNFTKKCVSCISSRGQSSNKSDAQRASYTLCGSDPGSLGSHSRGAMSSQNYPCTHTHTLPSC